MKKTAQLIVVLSVLVLALVQCNVIWLPPGLYAPPETFPLNPPVMTLKEYTGSGIINTHARPYIYGITSKTGNGAVLVFGAEHSKDPNHKQVGMLESEWDRFNPTAAMLEGRLGYLITWLHNPIAKKGESGFTAKRAKSKHIRLYTWEPGREAEVTALVQKGFHPKLLSAFYCIGVHHNNWKDVTHPDKEMQTVIRKRTKQYPLLNNTLHYVSEIDSIWKAECPGLPDWRVYKHPRNGWPAGKLEDIADMGNYVRDEHLCRSIIDLVRKGQRVFVTMGSSHAVVIEKTLRAMLQ